MGINRSMMQINDVGDYHLPDSVRHLGDVPLYRAVALWGLVLDKEFTRNDVCHAFRIEPKRASSILNYICNRIEDSDIVFSTRRPPSKRGNQLMFVRIIAIGEKKAKVKMERKNSPPPPESCDFDRVMANWVLTKPCNSNPENLKRWRNACPVSNKTAG